MATWRAAVENPLGRGLWRLAVRHGRLRGARMTHVPRLDWYQSLSKPVWPHYRWAAAAQVPYFVWVSIATVLQLSITWMNRG